MQHPQDREFKIFGSESLHPSQYDIVIRFSLKQGEVVKTVVMWLWTFAKVCRHVIVLFYVEFKTMIAM